MSRSQPTLDEFHSTPEDSPDTGADHVVVERTEWTDFSGEQEPACGSCGGSVPDHVSRVMGDDEGDVPGCPRCVPDKSRWSAAIREARGNSLAPGERR